MIASGPEGKQSFVLFWSIKELQQYGMTFKNVILRSRFRDLDLQ